jgi:hypothetical protein
VSLLARDWEGVKLLLGNLSLADQVRLNRSSRMLVSRLHLVSIGLAPFALVGLGQWRLDAELLPAIRHETALAGQLGGGLEVPLGDRAAVAAGADCTFLGRTLVVPQMIGGPHPWSAFVAARASF